MTKINLGCGGNLLTGWDNYDLNVDITKPLPFADNSASFILAEHVVEHTTTPDSVRFFRECNRVLEPFGVVRIAVPSASRILELSDEEYLNWFGKSGFGTHDKQSAVSSILLNHGHLSAWNYPTLRACLFAAGFPIDGIGECNVGQSVYPELCNVEGHGRVIGDHNNWVETIVAEAVK